MSRREELIKELGTIWDCNCEHCYGRQEKIAEIVLRRERAVLGEIRKPLDKHMDDRMNNPDQASAVDAVEETLAIIDDRLTVTYRDGK